MARKILLADDSVTAQNMGRKILADAGYEVITVNNGSAALKKIAEQKPDLIVLDVYMPGYSGLEVCQRLKEVPDSSRIPILLTVGKLEPFKPEEARRVRADGFIVKPFEASELLSALTKLEDRIVPRSEPSKPGRFARATAAIEESRFDRSMVEEDSGWKNRIVFPKKKEEKPPEPEIEEAAIYNPVNKDLRTVVEHKPEDRPAVTSGEHEEERVNLAALAPEGLPKDVTPEEIAALAAAAAQVKGKIAESKLAEQTVSEEKTEAVKSTEPVAAIAAANEEPGAREQKEEAPATEVASAPAPEVSIPEGSPATLAEQAATIGQQSEPSAVPSPADVMAAIVDLERHSISMGPVISADESWSARKRGEEPVTMAVAAAAAGGASSSRWTAVAVALVPEEASLSLELEMLKASTSSPVAVEDTPVPAADPSSEPVRQELTSPAPDTSERSSSEPATAALPSSEPAAALPEPVPAQSAEATASAKSETESAAESQSLPSSFAEIASAAKEAVGAAITEFASVAASYLGEKTSADPEPAPVTATEPVAETGIESLTVQPPQAQTNVEQPSAAGAMAEIPNTAEKIAEAAVMQSKTAEPDAVDVAVDSNMTERSLEKSATNQISADQTAMEQRPTEHPQSEQTQEKREVAEQPAEVPAPATPAVEVAESSTAPAVAEVPAFYSISSTAGGIDEMAKKESEIAANTAAAWASWRKIRETGSPKAVQAPESEKEVEEAPISQDSAAMAVAVGAESSPEEVTSALDSDPEIASIVDSVLADMRPKIVEEIARKLGKKK